MSKQVSNHPITKSNAEPKRWIRIALLMGLLIAAAVLVLQKPFHISSQSTVPMVTPSSTAQRSTSGRDQREMAYDKDIATLEALLEDETLDEETKAQASLRLTSLVDDHQSEMGIEEALQSAGFAPVLVLMQYGSLTVMLEQDTLTQEESVTVLSLCVAHSDIALANIRIMTSQAV